MDVTKLYEHNLHSGAIYSTVLNQNSVFTTGGDGKIIEFFYESDTAKLIAQTDQQIFSLLHFPSANQIWFGDLKGGIHILDRNQNSLLKSLNLHQRPIYKLIKLNDWVIACSGDGAISIWDKNSFDLIKVIPISKENIRSISYFEPLQILLVGASDGNMYSINLNNFQVERNWAVDEKSVFAICTVPNGLITGGRDAKLKFWQKEGEDIDLIHVIPAHSSTINAIRWNSKKNWIATASRDKQIRIWDAESFELYKVINLEKQNGHRNSVNTLEWANENTLISCGDDRRVILWSID